MRSNRLKILDGPSIWIIVIASFMAYFIKEEATPIIILSISLYLQVFLIGTGRGLKDLYNHYIYLIPSSSFSKIVWSNMEVVFKNVVESILMFVMVGLIVNADPAVTVACILVRSGFALLLVSANILSMRIFKDVLSQGLVLIIYFLFIALILAPGIVLAIFLSAISHVVVGLLGLMLWEIALSLLFFYLSRGVLHAYDMPTMQKKA